MCVCIPINMCLQACNYVCEGVHTCGCMLIPVLWPGLHTISNLDEVAFIQNLVFYIEAAYKVAVSEAPHETWSL